MTECIHDLDLRFMSDSPDNTPIALLAACKTCHATWPFDASVKDDLMPLENAVATLREQLAEAEAAMRQFIERLDHLKDVEQPLYRAIEDIVAEMKEKYPDA